MLKRNLFANYSGQVWTALMGFAFVPLYVRYLGVEAYGVIGIFGALLAWLALLDAGLKPALGREMARFTGGASSPESAWDLLRSVEWVCLFVGLLVYVSVLIFSEWFATQWINAKELQPKMIVEAVSYMGAIAALKFVEGIYSSCLSGMQRHVSMNVASAGLATVRSVGALAVLVWIQNSLTAFFQWQLIVSIFSVLLFRYITYRVMPVAVRRPAFVIAELKSIWRYAGGIFILTLLGLLLTQIDKVLLSTLISLEDFGRYTLASLAAGVLFTLISPISTTFLPRLTQLHAAGEKEAFSTTFHRGAQLIAVIGGGVTATVAFNSEAVLEIWLHDPVLAQQTSTLLTLLLLGNLMNGLCHMLYQAQLAHGITRITMLINGSAAVILIPLIFAVVPVYGAVGAAAIWTLLNLIYLLAFAIFPFQVILQSERWNWIFGDMLKPLLVVFAVSGLGRWIMPEGLNSWLAFVFMGCLTVFACVLSLLVSRDLMRAVSHNLRSRYALIR